jgi:uncharacterized protein (DUF362 family)
LVTAGASLTGCFPDVGGEWAQERAVCVADPELPLVSEASVVAEVLDEASVTYDSDALAFVIDEARVPDMLRDLLGTLAGDPADPWPVLLPDYATGMRIGLKVNVLNPQCATTLPLVRAVADDLQDRLGVPAADILVWDRRLDELTRSGFTEAALGVPVAGTVNATDDPDGPGYEKEYCPVIGDQTTRLSRILTELTDVTINLPVLKSHGVSGVTGAMKNIYGVIHNPAAFHANLNDGLPALYALEPIRTRLRLTILDALIAVTVGGTSSPPDAIPKRLAAARDPVALDARALELVNEERAAKTPSQQAVDASYTAWLDNAHQAGLGARQIDLHSVVR